MNTKETGRITQAKVLAKLVENGENVLLPFCDVGRYDLALDQGGKLVRIECKTGRLRNGAVVFPTASTKWYGGFEKKSYHNDADFIGIYCPETEEVYLVPVDETGTSEGRLRVDPPHPRSNQTRIRWAKDYAV